MRWYQPAQWQLWWADINRHSDNSDVLISTCTLTTVLCWYQIAQWQLLCADINRHSDNCYALISTCTVTTCHLRQVLHDLTDICKCICKAICRKFGIQEHKHCLPTSHSGYTFEHLTPHGDWRMASRRQRIYRSLNPSFRDTAYLLILSFVSVRCPEGSFQCVYLSVVYLKTLSIS